MLIGNNEWSVLIVMSVKGMSEKEYRRIRLEEKKYKTASFEAKEVIKDWKKRIKDHNKTATRRYYNVKFYLENDMSRSWPL